MHCWKVINVERDFGITRIVILSILAFLISFSFSFVALSFNHPEPYTDKYFFIFILILFLLYPIHKFIHYIFLVDFHNHIVLKVKYRFKVFPIIHLKLKKLVSKYRYLSSLLAPFIFLNSIILFLATRFPEFSHYFSLLFGVHCLICLIDLLNVNGIIRAPHHAFIEETPKGYEVLVPIDIDG